MKPHTLLRAAFIALLLQSLLGGTGGKITPAEREEEARWLQSLGVQVPEGGWPLENPFVQPWTRRSLIVPTAWYRQRAPEKVKADLFRADVKLLRQIMENVYGGWQTAERRGWKWGEFFDRWDADLAAQGSAEIALQEAMAPWKKLMEFQLDNHSGPLSLAVAAHAGSWSAVLAKAPAAACTEFRNTKGTVYPINSLDPAQLPKKREDSEGRPIYYLTTPSIKGPLEAVHCGSEWIPAKPAWFPTNAERSANIRALAQTETDVPTYRSISPQIGYIRFPSFSKPAVELTIKLEATLKDLKPTEGLLIVDLRGNEGGDERLNALGHWVKPPNVSGKTRIAASCLYHALRWGYMQISSASLKPPISGGMRTRLQASLNDLLKNDAPGCPSKFTEESGNWSYLQHRYPVPTKVKTRLLALVDEGCGSDCEGAMITIAAIPGSVIAGVNSYGVAQFIQPGYFVLPNTRLPFRIALGTADDYGDNRSFDGYGFDVDILLPTQAEMSAENILRLAQRLIQ